MLKFLRSGVHKAALTAKSLEEKSKNLHNNLLDYEVKRAYEMGVELKELGLHSEAKEKFIFAAEKGHDKALIELKMLI